MDRITPSWTYLTSSVVVIGISIFFVSVGLSALAVTWDPCSVIGGALLLPFPLATGLLQYGAAFRRNPRAAKSVAVLLFAENGLVLFGAVTSAAEALVQMERLSWTSLGVLAVVFGLGSFGVLCGWFNLRWARLLRTLAAAEPGSTHDNPFQFSLRELFAWTAIIALTMGLTVWGIRGIGPQLAEHVTAREAGLTLPPGATDVCCFRGFRGNIAYEFSIDEVSFFDWASSGILSPEAEAADVAVKPIAGSFRMLRYLGLQSGNAGNEYVTIVHGYCYSWSKEDRRIEFAYDLDTKRAYYYLQTY